jgi:cytochrome P450
MAVEALKLRTIDDLPEPSGLPLIGNAYELMRSESMHRTFEEWAGRYGPIFRFDIGRQRAVVISDFEEINTILRNRPEGFRRWATLQKLNHELMYSNSLIYAEGADWKRQRRLVVTALNTNNLHLYFDIIATSTERLHRRLVQAARDGGAIEIQHDLTSYTVDITSALVFGQDLNTLERGENELDGHIRLLMRMVGRRLSIPIPYWRWVKLPADRALERSVAEIDRAIHEFIEQAKARMSERPELRERPENFMEGMLAAQEADGSYTDDEIIGNTLAILTAGEDTTALTLGWAIWFLASRPDVQTRLAQEADELLGEKPFLCEHEPIERMQYSEAVLREAIRLKSVVPMMPVEPLMDTTICDTRIPAGSHLLLLTHYASRQADVCDASFEPERWLEDGDGDLQAPSQKAFLGFGAGPRFCPGHNLAFLEAKTVLAMIARNFQFELDSSRGPVREDYTFAMAPKGLFVRLRERAANAADVPQSKMQPMSLSATEATGE